MKPKNCERCGWPLEAASARGGLTRHPGCGPLTEPDAPMLPLPEDETAPERKP